MIATVAGSDAAALRCHGNMPHVRFTCIVVTTVNRASRERWMCWQLTILLLSRQMQHVR